jgi:hypothetical protein
LLAPVTVAVKVMLLPEARVVTLGVTAVVVLVPFTVTVTAADVDAAYVAFPL